MKLVDANVLLHAVNTDSDQHGSASDWLDSALNDSDTLGFCWVALLAFIRIATRPGIFPRPLSSAAALSIVGLWLDASPAQVIHPGPRHLEILSRLVTAAGTGGNLTTDAHLAAVAIEQSAELWSFDRDFDRFPGLAFRLLGAQA
jgi:uncharacterized protein